MLKFHDLQEALRNLLWQRIESGELTGMALAQQTGFRQAHISNFLNRKRGLSLDGMDRVLAVEEISVLDLVPPEEINQRASIPPPDEDEYANLLLVGPQHAALPQVHARHVLDVLKLKHGLLRRMRAESSNGRENWLRFLMMKPGRSCCEAMAPRLNPGCSVLIDRHYNTLVPYRRGEKSMFAVRDGDNTVIRYLDWQHHMLMLDTENKQARAKLIPVPSAAKPEDLIVGRVAFVCMEV